MVIASILFIIGLIGLWKSSDWLIDSGSAIAAHYQISPLLIGLSLVAFGTSAPELVINALASFKHQPAIVWGNVLGSNIANTTLILGLTAIITPLCFKQLRQTRLLAAHALPPVCLLGLIARNPTLGASAGCVLLLLLAGYMILLYRSNQLPCDSDKNSTPLRIAMPIFVLACIALPSFAYLVLTQATTLAKLMGIPELIISLFFVSLGSSLPELATCINAAVKRNTGLVLGNIIGSNIFNIAFVLGVSACIRPIAWPGSLGLEAVFVLALPIGLWLLSTIVHALHRGVGIILFMLYGAYILYYLL
ncbi:calcium/sodium antiporter [Candidatus Marinamargulisbacteria bacterium]|jgi:cation:H+ antiporter|nr:sodium:calcium antiporter [bacterium]MDA7564020.1 calcium/sodium antiporter [Candidatus Marinamargulisbacteria bacterium]|tara:strand:- start:6418 stop:7335 length:918 start_codon:yes stop_codon:yes gene_type:complete